MSDPATSTDTNTPGVVASTTSAPIFGGSDFKGTSGGFAAFTGVKPLVKDQDGEAAADEPEEECKAVFTPLVQLEEVEVNTGEENEECMLELKCKMYRYDKENKEWKERGIGQAKFLRSKESKKIRFLMRQEKTLKIRANHIVMPGTKISSHGGNDKAWVWSALDFADEEQKMEMLAIRFGTVEKAAEFKEQYEKAGDLNAALLKDLPAAEVKAETPDPAVEKVAAEADKLADKVAATAVAE